MAVGRCSLPSACSLLCWREPVRAGAQVVDAAMVEGAAVLMGAFFALSAAGSWSKEPRTNLLDTGAPFYDVYETSDGKFVAVGALEPKFFAELARCIGLDERFVRNQMDRRSWPSYASGWRQSSGRARAMPCARNWKERIVA